MIFDELLRQAAENATSGRLCEGPPIEMPEELKREIERALASVPIATTVPSDAPAGVINIHRRLVPC